MQKIKQRFSLTQSATPPPISGGTWSPQNATSTSPNQPRHRKNRSLVDGINGLLHGVHSKRPTRHKVLHPNTSASHTASHTDHHRLASEFEQKSQSFSHSHGNGRTKNKAKMTKPNKRRRHRRRGSEHRAQSILPKPIARTLSNNVDSRAIQFTHSLEQFTSGSHSSKVSAVKAIPVLPEHDESDRESGADLVSDDDDNISPLRSFAPAHSKSRSRSSLPQLGASHSARPSARSFSSARSARHSMAVGILPRPQSPRTFVEHEKNTLMEQMRQLQSSMVQLGDMLRNQDLDLVRERTKNEKLTAQVNDLADENIRLRNSGTEQRHERNSLWLQFQEQKQGVKERSDQILWATDRSNKLCAQIAELEAQKSELSAYSQTLLSQLTTERKQNETLRTKIRKYSRNVRSLHKRTSSMSGLSKYTIGPLKSGAMMKQTSSPMRKKPNTARFASRAFSPATPPIAEYGAPSASPVMAEQRHNMDLQQKRLELQELERHTLDILNQLQEETKLLLGETAQSAAKRSRSASPSPSPSKRTPSPSKSTARENSPSVGESEEKEDVVQTITTKTRTTKKTKTKTTKTTINGNVVLNSSHSITEEDTEEKTEEVTKTKISHSLTHSDNDESDELDQSDFESDEEGYEAEEREVCLLPRRASVHYKEEVAMLKKADAPLTLMFAAFEKQMACEVNEFESETPSPVAVITVVPEATLTPTSTQGGDGDEPTVSSMFANFDGFSSDEEDTNEAAQSLWD